MKKTISLLGIAILAGTITLSAYKLLFEKESNFINSPQEKARVFTTNNTTAPMFTAEKLDFTSAAEKTIHSVVHVKNLTTTSNRSNIMEFFYGQGRTQRQQVGTGSGVIISPDGYIVTNNHVIANSSQLQVTLNNNKTYDAKLIGTDPESDIALLKIEADEKLPSLTFGDSDASKIGEWVLAVGNPFNLTSTVTAGIISAKARDLGKNQSFIQTDAAVNPGNSGGALVNTNGDLIGINTAITSKTGSYVGYSFAVPSNNAKKIVNDILEYGNVQKGMLGIQGTGLNDLNTDELKIDETQGVYISKVLEDSGAEEAGIKEGDIIKQIDDISVSKMSNLTGYISTKRPGDEVSVQVFRSGKIKTIPVTLKRNNIFEIPNLGFSVKNLSKKDKKIFKTNEGVKITKTAPYMGNSLVGKVLIEINGEKIRNVEDARIASKTFQQYQRPSVIILNKKRERERLIFQ